MTYLAYVWHMSGTCLGHALDMSGKFLDISQIPGTFENSGLVLNKKFWNGLDGENPGTAQNVEIIEWFRM